jgi:hypothetical protein
MNGTSARNPHFAHYGDARLRLILAMARERAAVHPEGSPDHDTARAVERMVLADLAETAEGDSPDGQITGCIRTADEKG